MKKKIFLEIYQQFIQLITKSLNVIQKKFSVFNEKYPVTSQNIQLTFIYFFALVDLIYSILNNVFAIGYNSESIKPFLPTIQMILESPIFKVWGSPEKVFFMSYVLLEFVIIKSVFKIPKFIKYNILLAFALIMLQGLMISVWDLLFHREISEESAPWTFDSVLIDTNADVAIFFFLFTFIFFVIFYYHFYSNALNRKIVPIRRLEWITDSVAFWLRIKTPTMKKFGENDNPKK